MKQFSAAIFGASGYSGGELIRILSKHPHVALANMFAQTSAGVAVSDVHSWYDDSDQAFEQYTDAAAVVADICFLALPHGEAMRIAPALIAAGKIVIDLSGDHRISDSTTMERYYGFAPNSDRYQGAVYGLPEWNSAAIHSARLIANPGCYATSILLPILPFVHEGLVDSKSIVVNSLSGVSGAGRKASLDLSFAEVNETVKAYRVGDHQHTPEIESTLVNLTGQSASVTFIPHLIPITRGIYSTSVLNLTQDLSQELAIATLEKYYGAQPFVRINAKRPPEIKDVLRTNTIAIGVKVIEERKQLILMSCIDNLIKGAAGQAVQNMNIACGFAETAGLV